MHNEHKRGVDPNKTEEPAHPQNDIGRPQGLESLSEPRTVVPALHHRLTRQLRKRNAKEDAQRSTVEVRIPAPKAG